MISYNNKIFRAVKTADNSEVGTDMVFHYHQTDNILHCAYHGGKIKYGHLIGVVAADGSIDMCYHQINEKGVLMAGTCKSTPEVIAEGKIRLHETWQWTLGDASSGTTILEEV